MTILHLSKSAVSLGTGLRTVKGGEHHSLPELSSSSLPRLWRLIRIISPSAFPRSSIWEIWTLALGQGSSLQLYPRVPIRATNNIVLAVGNNAAEHVLFVFVLKT